MPNGTAWPLRSLLTSLAPWGRLLRYLHMGKPMLLRLPLDIDLLRVGPRLRQCNSSRPHRKENAVIIFGHAPRLILKVALLSSNLARDIRMHRVLGESTGCTPRLVASDPNLRWLVCEYHEHGKGLSRKEKGRHFLEQIAPRYYEYWKPRPHRVKRLLQRQRITPHAVREFLHDLGVELPDDFENATLPFSMPYLGNIRKECFQDAAGRTLIVDWEDVRTGPLAEGMLRLYPEHAVEVLDFISRYTDPDDLEPLHQLAVAAAVQALGNRHHRQRMERVCRHIAATLKQA
ncbi:hypothetical protein [Thioalkalivibrio denitrificans]|uniref:hypothetical protein n=1 Tax=Thioalkalivibrio denitrificans TaxID=108003 RepID=UPI0011156A34|nr:hypothetical protein [Thioalkalivibrio denitrificans]